MNEYAEYGLILVIVVGAGVYFLRRILASRGDKASCGCGCEPEETRMPITLVGGMDRLRRDYESAAKQLGVNLTVCTGKESCLADKMGAPKLTILLTDMVSHNAKTCVLQKSKRMGTPVHFLKSNGVSGLRRYLGVLMTGLNK